MAAVHVDEGLVAHLGVVDHPQIVVAVAHVLDGLVIFVRTSSTYDSSNVSLHAN